MSAQEQACQSVPLPPQVPADGGGQGTASLLLQKPLLSCVPHCYAQEVSRLCHLSAGTYRVVPSTYLPDTEGSFTVTIATRIDRWGHAAGCGPQCPGATFALCSPACPTAPALSCPGRDEADTRACRLLAHQPVGVAWMGLGVPAPPPPHVGGGPGGLTEMFCPAGAPSTARKGWGSSSRRYDGALGYSLIQPPHSGHPAVGPCLGTQAALVSSPERPLAELLRG